MDLQELLNENLAQLDGTKLIFSNGLKRIKGDIYLRGYELTEVDFNDLEYLDDIDLSFNNLASVDFKNLIKINSVLLNNNPLENIDFRELEEIDTLNVSATLLQSLDLRKFSEIGDIFLPKSIKELNNKDKDFKIKRNITVDRIDYKERRK